MGTYNIHAGHNFMVPGAEGYFSETMEARNIKNRVIALLRSDDNIVYDCTDEKGDTIESNIKNIIDKQNAHDVDLDISIHFSIFNNGISHGVEILTYDSKTTDISNNVLRKIESLGFYNNGIKDWSDLDVLRKSNSKAILIKCCYCDSAKDNKLYNASMMSKAIVEGIIGKPLDNYALYGTIYASNLFRVRQSWNNSKTEIGRYQDLKTAKIACDDNMGYNIYSNNGKLVYSNQEMYRVRKSWEDVKSQTGAYKDLNTAKDHCIEGYGIFDNDGNMIYSICNTTIELDDEVKVGLNVIIKIFKSIINTIKNILP